MPETAVCLDCTPRVAFGSAAEEMAHLDDYPDHLIVYGRVA